MAKPSLKPDDPEQSKRFIELATEFGADSSVDQFDRAFRKVAAAPRAPKPAKRTRAKPAKKGK